MQILKIVLLFFLFQFFEATGYAQNSQKTDSLLHVLENSDLSEKEHVRLLIKIASNHPEPSKASYYAKLALETATKINAPVLRAQAWEEIGVIEQRLGNKGTALKAIFNALQLYDSLDLKENQAASYMQIADHYITESEYPTGITYLKKAQDIYDEVKNELYITFTHINLGETYRLSGNFEESEKSLRKALELNKHLKDKSIEGYSLGNLGMLYARQNKSEIAKEYLYNAITTLTVLGDPYSLSVYTEALGKIYIKEGQFVNAEALLLKAITIAKEAGLKEQVRDFSASITDLYQTQKRFEKALEFQKIYQHYQDSLVNKANIQKVEQIKAGYEIEKRESEITLLNTVNTNQKYWVIFLIIGVLLLLLFSYLLYKGNKKIKNANQILRTQKELISKREQEKVLLLQELNHRVKNNLQMIASLLNLQSRELTGHPAKEAILSGKYRVEALSLVHRKLYQEGVDTKIVLKEYIEELVLGLFQGYNARFKPTFSITDISISIDIAIPLALIINELVINALKYAYEGIENPLLNIIMLQEDKESMHLQIIDNGVGFKTDKNTKDNSFGIKLITSLIEQLEGTIKKLDTTGTHWEMNIKL